jgi:hypothetical protein
LGKGFKLFLWEPGHRGGACSPPDTGPDTYVQSRRPLTVS